MIVGIDPGMRRLAAVWLNGEDADHGQLILNHPQSERGTELQEMSEELDAWLSLLGDAWDFQDLVVFCEAPIVGMSRNYQTALHIAETVGMIHSLPYKTYTVAPSTWKKVVVGNGRATKAQVADWLRQVKPGLFDSCAGDQDAVDATCIALYGEHVRRTTVGIGRQDPLRGLPGPD